VRVFVTAVGFRQREKSNAHRNSVGREKKGEDGRRYARLKRTNLRVIGPSLRIDRRRVLLLEVRREKPNAQRNSVGRQKIRIKNGRRYVRLKRTNLRVIGLSLNRSQKSSALLSTTPRLRTRSSTNDFAPLRRM
jgi:hypothetical protein